MRNDAIESTVKNKRSSTRQRSGIGVVSSVPSNGKTINTENHNQSELRDVGISLPYGISSSALDGMKTNIMIDDGNIMVIGVLDSDRPDVRPGEVIIYSKFGQMIQLREDGNVTISVAAGKGLVVDTIQANHIICPDVKDS